MNIVLAANNTTFVYNLRREVIGELMKAGHRVTVLAQFSSHADTLAQMGCELIDISISRRGTNPLEDLKLMMQFLRILRQCKPDLVFLNNIKPNVYGGMACRILGTRYVPNITGLGTAVEYPGRMQKLTTRLYQWGVSGADSIFFQNEENLRFFRERGMMPGKAKVYLLPGSGVNLESHPELPYSRGDTVHFLFVARLLKEKGIELYLAAAKRIAQKHPAVMFHICGGCDDPRYLDLVAAAQAEGHVRYHGEQKDMTPFFRTAHCLVHPSYYPEGMSNVLLEAASSGRPVIATDRSGCRETVDAGVTGYRIPIKDEDALVQALEDFLSLTWDERERMGRAGRQKMEREFDRRLVVATYIEVLGRCPADVR